MAKLTKDGHVVVTDYAPEIVALRSQGYTDAPKPKTTEAVKAESPKSTK